MNAYDFDKTIYDGDSTADFYFFSLKRHKKILTLFPSLARAFIKFYLLKKGTKTEFKELMYRFLKYCDIPKDVNDFWDINQHKIKDFYLEQHNSDDVIISASPKFLLDEICSRLKIKYLIASNVDSESGIYFGINCHGEEKVRRFYNEFGENTKIDKFYSDSYSDTPTAKIADKAYIVKRNKIYDWNFK